MDNILYIQLHHPCENMMTWCTDCWGLHDYSNNSGGQFELSCSVIFFISLACFLAKWMPAGPDSDSHFCVLPVYDVHAVPNIRMRRQT